MARQRIIRFVTPILTALFVSLPIATDLRAQSTASSTPCEQDPMMIGRFGTAVYALCYQMGNVDRDVGISAMSLVRREGGRTTTIHRADGSKPAARFWVSATPSTVRIWATTGTSTVVLSQCVNKTRCASTALTLHLLQGETVTSRVTCTPSSEFGTASDGQPVVACDINGIDGSTSGANRTVFAESRTTPAFITKLAAP